MGRQAGRLAAMGGGRPGRWLVLSLGAFALLATALFVASTLSDRRATLDQGRIDAENTAALLAEQADRALRVAEITTARVAAIAAERGLGWLRGPGWAEFSGLDAAAPEIGSLWVFDADGRLFTNSLSREPPPADFSDRDFLAPLRAGGQEHLSGLAYGRISGLWFYSWNRAIRAEGRFLGVAQASIHGEEFARVAESLALGPGAVLRVARADGAPLMRWPLPDRGTLPDDPPPPGPRGHAEETGPDGLVRLVAWRRAPTMPVVAVAAISRDHVLEPFRRRLLRNGLLFGLSLALAGSLAAAALRAGRREAAARLAAEERGAALTAALAGREALLASVQEGEARLRLAEQAGGIGAWDWDLRDRRLTVVGDIFAGWGLPPGLPAGPRGFRILPLRAALRAIHPADRRAARATLAAALRDGTAVEVEVRLARPGAQRWIALRAEPRPDPDGWPRRLLGVALDVTARRRQAMALAEANATLERRVAERTGALAEANARLREGEARFRGIFNGTFQFIGLLSPDGTLLEANEAMLRLGGVAAPQVIGRPYWDAPWWPDDPALRALVRDGVAAAAAGLFFRRETAMRDAAGRTISIDFSVTPVRDEDGLVSLLVPEARDISDLKAAQALLHEAAKMDTLGHLTGSVAHDFNNLLMAVLGNLALARRRLGPGAPEVLRHLDAATQSAERGAMLTQRLLAFARRQDLRPAAVDLAALLAGMKDLLRRSAGPLATVVVEVPPGLPPAQVDPHALELALMNLAVNARDAMPGGGRLTVAVDLAAGDPPPGLAPGRWLAIAVTDTGQGMDEATLRRAVEPFFSTKAPGQGTGLGLSMVHGLAAQSGGALEIRSVPGEGTTATLWLPVAGRPAAAPQPRQDAAPILGSGAVLLVDDEALVLESTAAMLEELGYDVIRAASGEEALGALARHPHLGLVVTDYAMPGMTGATLAQRVAERRPGLPVILATGHAGPWPDTPGAPARLAKPYSLTELSEAVAAALRGNGAAATRGEAQAPS
ncbi:PAS domain-containing protein [Falsiroseomonas sp. CW058]|uniref:PAS domain-containing protein n=1 Tax=Falsiroseomonas sp. CW058 TaxID=3388664 RepID=UPI003D31C90D